MEQQSGFKTVEWNGTNDIGKRVSAGIYFYDIQAGDFRKTRMMVLLK
jgi:flagellar hook assembly protein FlgD